MVAEDGCHPIQYLVRNTTIHRKKNCSFHKAGTLRCGIVPAGHGAELGGGERGIKADGLKFLYQCRFIFHRNREQPPSLMRVAKSGRAQTRRELVVQVIAGMTTNIEICAPVMSQTPAEERQLGQGGLLAEQLDEVASLEPTDCRNNVLIKINIQQTAYPDKQAIRPSMRQCHNAAVFQGAFSKAADRLGLVAA